MAADSGINKEELFRKIMPTAGMKMGAGSAVEGPPEAENSRGAAPSPEEAAAHLAEQPRPAAPAPVEPAAPVAGAAMNSAPAPQKKAAAPRIISGDITVSTTEAEVYPLNVMELIVDKYVERYISRFGVCACESCHDDICAITLNRVRPHYKANTLITEEDLLNRNLVSATVSELVKATLLVKRKPSHA